MSGDFRVDRTEVVFHSFVFDVQRRTVVHGAEVFERDVAAHPGAVAILAVNDRGEVGLIRQYRATFDTELWEIPAGTQDVEGESPLEAAQRELREEMGVEASQWRLLGRFMNSPGWTDQIMTVYEARGLRDVPREPAGPEERSAGVHWLAPEVLFATLRDLPAFDSTMAIALLRVFGDFLERP